MVAEDLADLEEGLAEEEGFQEGGELRFAKNKVYMKSIIINNKAPLVFKEAKNNEITFK